MTQTKQDYLSLNDLWMKLRHFFATLLRKRKMSMEKVSKTKNGEGEKK